MLVLLSFVCFCLPIFAFPFSSNFLFSSLSFFYFPCHLLLASLSFSIAFYPSSYCLYFLPCLYLTFPYLLLPPTCPSPFLTILFPSISYASSSYPATGISREQTSSNLYKITAFRLLLLYSLCKDRKESGRKKREGEREWETEKTDKGREWITKLIDTIRWKKKGEKIFPKRLGHRCPMGLV